MFPVCVCDSGSEWSCLWASGVRVQWSSELEMNIRGFISLFLLINLIRKISSSMQKNPETFRFQRRQICIWILSLYTFIRICVASQVCIMEACADRSYWVLFLMKPHGDIPPQSNTDHFPWHVPTSSLREMISFNSPGRLKAEGRFDLFC